MKNFRLIDTIDPTFILEELTHAIRNGYIEEDLGAQRRAKWVKETNYCSNHPYSGWLDLYATYRINETYREEGGNHCTFIYKTKNCGYFPKTFLFLKKIAKKEKGILQRVSIVLLPPDKEVLPHFDFGEYYKARDRYHVVLQANHGSEFTSGEEKQILKEGEIWWFANKKVHSVKNLSTNSRIHIIFDVLPKTYYSRREKIIHSILGFLFQKTRDLLGPEGFSAYMEANLFWRNTLLYSK